MGGRTGAQADERSERTSGRADERTGADNGRTGGRADGLADWRTGANGGFLKVKLRI